MCLVTYYLRRHEAGMLLGSTVVVCLLVMLRVNVNGALLVYLNNPSPTL